MASTGGMNFEGFKDLISRVAMQWYGNAKKEILDFEAVDAYLEKNPFTAEQTSDNEEAYEKLMDVRCKLYVSYFHGIFFYPKGNKGDAFLGFFSDLFRYVHSLFFNEVDLCICRSRLDAIIGDILTF